MRDWPHSLRFSRRELDIHCSGPNLDSGIFRVVQYRASTQVNLREKTGMTVVRVVCNESNLSTRKTYKKQEMKHGKNQTSRHCGQGPR